MRKCASKAFVALLGTTGDDCIAYQALAVLYALVLFQLYSGDPDAVPVLSDLEEFRGRFDSKRDDEATTAFLVETLLSLIARPSPLARQVSKHVFGKFAPYVSMEALRLLTEPLCAGENLEGHKKLFATEDEMDASEVDLDSEVDDPEISEDGLAGSEVDDHSNESESEEDEEDDATDADSDAQQKAFEDDLAKLLKTHRPDQEDDTESEAGSDMTDTEMMAIDGQISAAFKGRKAALPPSKKDHKNAKESVIHFKNRILDLVTTYLEWSTKRSDDSSRAYTKRSVVHALQLLPDLVRLAATTTSKDLASRASDVIFTYKKEFKKEKEQWVREIEGEGGGEKKARVFTILKQIHDELGSQESQTFAKTASTACLTLASALQAAGMLGDVKELHEATKKEKEGKVQRSFFENWQNWCVSQKV
jgi:DNA polymerase phi